MIFWIEFSWNGFESNIELNQFWTNFKHWIESIWVSNRAMCAAPALWWQWSWWSWWFIIMIIMIFIIIIMIITIITITMSAQHVLPYKTVHSGVQARRSSPALEVLQSSSHFTIEQSSYNRAVILQSSSHFTIEQSSFNRTVILQSSSHFTIEQSLAVSPKSRFKPNINSSISTLLSIQCWCSAVLGGGAGPAIWYDPSFTLHCLQKDKKDRNVCENIKKYKFLHLHSPLDTVLV